MNGKTLLLTVVSEETTSPEVARDAPRPVLQHIGHLLGLEPWQRMEGDLALGVFMEDAIEEDRMHVRVEPQVTRCPLHDEHGSALPHDPILRREPSPVECKHCVGELPDDRAEKAPRSFFVREVVMRARAQLRGARARCEGDFRVETASRRRARPVHDVTP